jgi:3-hydroxybutyryl-CoA dehydrogenase
MISSICICGAGTMGSGIAQVAAQSGFSTILYDLDEAVLEKSKMAIQTTLQRLADKQIISRDEVTAVFERIIFTNNITLCKADVIIEAIAENAEAKVSLINQLTGINNDTVIFATNTSSLSISELQQKISMPGRLAGMHFFNPAPLMKLVEVIKAHHTSEEVAQSIFQLAIKMGKIPVMCSDSPGFIVNRVARHYYLEALKLLEQKVATIENIDRVMESAGFKMGPFKLMDLIGMDINLAVSQSIYDAFDKAERFKPSALQIEKVENGQLGRKSHRGFYDYNPG